MKLGFTCNIRRTSNSGAIPDGVGGSARFDDEYAEWDAPETVEAIRAALATRHDVTLLEVGEDLPGRIRTVAPDLVFNIAEGLEGVSREAQVPALLEWMGIPYTGSDPLTLALTLDKGMTTDILRARGVAVPRHEIVEVGAKAKGVLGYPVFVKPLHEGSSKGIFNDSLAPDRDALDFAVERIHGRYEQPALVEEFLPGEEFTAALLGNGEKVEVLPLVRIDFGSLPDGIHPVYSYEAKWIWDQPNRPVEIFQCPARIDDELYERIVSLCRRAFLALRCRDWSRIDVRLDAFGEPRILEVNPLPGMLPRPEENSCFPKAARAAGYTFDDVLLRVVDEAAQRTGLLVRT